MCDPIKPSLLRRLLGRNNLSAGGREQSNIYPYLNRCLFCQFTTVRLSDIQTDHTLHQLNRFLPSSIYNFLICFSLFYHIYRFSSTNSLPNLWCPKWLFKLHFLRRIAFTFIQLIFTLAHKSDMTIAPSTAVKRSDSHITGNLKYLIFEDRIYIENKLNKGSPFMWQISYQSE